MTPLQIATLCIGATAVLYLIAAGSYVLAGRSSLGLSFCFYAAANIALLWEGLK
jgi:hypothetical protein